MGPPTSIEERTPASGPDRSRVNFPPPLIYIAGFMVGVALEVAFPIAALPLGLALAAAFIGVAIWLALDGAAMLHFRRARTSMVPMRPTTALVTSGPYGFTRNPMYVGMAVLYSALALSLGVIWALAVLPLVIIAVDRLVIAREEPYLERKFGDQYREYKSRVRRWI
jgi:protein-S-isoprenylcysteine O-methyltransferase Ste14